MQVDSNDRKPETGLQVLVVGGSIGGISTAIALKAQGHCVKVSISLGLHTYSDSRCEDL